MLQRRGNDSDGQRASLAMPEVFVPGGVGSLAVPPYLRLSDYVATS